MTRTTTALGLTMALLLAAMPALAHEDAKTKIDPSSILDITAPRPGPPSRAFDESLKREPPASPGKTEWKQQPDGSYKYGNTTIIIRHDCPPGGEFFEPPSLPGRRR
jgi:hypothetical protein